MTIACLIILALLLPLTIFDAFARPTIRRLGFRNVTRRAREAGLVIAGSMLATALITASFVVGDSFDSSIRDIARTRYGPIDEIISLESSQDLASVTSVLSGTDSPAIDGVLASSTLRVAAGSVGEDRLVEARVRVLEVDVAKAAQFGGDTADTGLADFASGLGPDELVINNEIATELSLSSGDPVDLFVGGQPYRFTVAGVAPNSGLGGFSDIITEPGALSAQLSNADSITGFATLVSNTGGVFSGNENTDEAVAAIRAATHPDIDINSVKADILLDAELEGEDTTAMFGTIGGFSVIAGILLVINLFVMLASERKTELGTMRALGMSRGSIIRSFTLEGAVYGAAAAVCGAVLGVGIGAAVVSYASTRLVEEGGATLSSSVHFGSLVSGAIIGMAISQLTVTFTSWQMTKLNIVRALKDLPEPRRSARPTRNLIVGIVGLLSAAGLWVIGGSTQMGVILIPVLAAISAIPVLSLIIPGRVAAVIGCAVGLGMTASVFGVFSDTLEDPAIEVFLLQGVLLVALGSAIVAVLDDVWLRVADRVSGGGVATKLGMAYPLARPIRSVMLVAMFALVLFMVTFMGVMNAVFSVQAPEMAHRAGGDYSMVVDSNVGAGLDAAELERFDGVQRATAVRRQRFEVSYESVEGGELQEPALDTVTVSFVEPDFAQVAPPAPLRIAPQFPDAAAAWQAVLTNSPSDDQIWVMAPDWMSVEPGSNIGIETSDGTVVTASVAGEVELGWIVRSGIYASAAVESVLDDSSDYLTSRFYLEAAQGYDPEAVAAALTASSPERGVDARAFTEAAQEELDEQETFLTMLSGYLGLGLLIGIAGLSVVLIRAVRERRRQIGMMRAVGISASKVRTMFVVEALFIGLQGVVLGLGLGTLSSWQILTKSSTFERGLGFTIPGAWLLGLGLVALGCSTLAAVGPALRAGKESPAEALRFTG